MAFRFSVIFPILEKQKSFRQGRTETEGKAKKLAGYIFTIDRGLLSRSDFVEYCEIF